MDTGKKKLTILTFLISVAIFCLPFTLSADTGPKPHIDVKVIYPPDEPYYLDLIEKNRDPERGAYGLFQNLKDRAKKKLNQNMLKALVDAIPEGWHACLTQGTSAPMSGDLTGSQQDGRTSLHHFGYFGTPDTYRILIVTQSGELFLSDVLHRDALQVSVVIDWNARTVKTPPAAFAYILQFLATFLPTILIEGVILLLFGYSFRKNWKPFLSANIVTQGGLAVYFSTTMIQNSLGESYYLYLLLAEIVITIIECMIYTFALKGYSRHRAIAYGITANICSAMPGIFLSNPLWNFIVSAS